MMNNEELREDSDSSDEDYVPDSKIEDAVSEVESDGDPETEGSENESRKGNKRIKNPKRKKVKKKNRNHIDNQNNDKLVVEPKESQEDQKKKADDLWADFMKDTGFKSKNNKSENLSSVNRLKPQQSTSKPDNIEKTDISKTDSKVKVTQVFEFAGEEVKVEKEVDCNSAEARLLSKSNTKTIKKTGSLSGIGSVLNQLGKKQKISTLEKSKLDWDRFKKEENIEEELQKHNKGKDGYLERQDFLQRADLRRFEIEKDIRNVERAKRFNNAL